MSFVFWLIVILAIMIAAVHFMSSDKYTTGMGLGDTEYLKFLHRKKPSEHGIANIPPPPSGIRDREIEALISSGQISRASDILGKKMEEARLAPVGSDRKLKDISHYLSLLH